MIHIFFLTIFFNILSSSNLYFDSDPFYLFHYEKQQFNQNKYDADLNIRPTFKYQYNNQTSLSYNAWYYYNDNAPNLENTSNRWVAKGNNLYNSIHFDYFNDYLYFSIEPYFFTSENLSFNSQHEDPLFQALNDGIAHAKRPYLDYGFRESQIILHRKNLGIGLSNTNMWWGPGLHNSLHISNNTSGFNYLFLGTTSEKRIKSFGYNFKYIFSQLDKNKAEPYYTGVAADITYHSDPIITLGFFRSFLSGGLLTTDNITRQDAMLLPFQKLFKEGLEQDQVDQTLSVFTTLVFPESGLKLYFELGMNDHRWDMYDFLQHPDHTAASIIGFRKYGLFNKKELIMGFEYTNLRKTRFDNRSTPNWYNRAWFDYHLYDGRRFTAHSGSDSDDLSFYLGYLSDSQDIIVSFNYERHGITESVEISEQEGLFYVPEFKLEFKVDARKKIKAYELYLFYEFEYLDNLGIAHQGIDRRFDEPNRKSNVFGIGFSKEIN